MAVIQNSFTGNGSTTTYSFTFPYLKTADIKASLDSIVTTAFTLPTATTLQFNTAPANGAKILIYRETEADALTATFYAGSAIKSEDLNDNFTQNLYGVQEVTGRYLPDTGGTLTGDIIMGEDAVIKFEGATDNANETTLTVTDPTADRTITLPNVTGTVVTTGDTGTVTSAMIADSTIVNGDIANTTITGGKLVNDTITATQIAANAVTASELANDAVDTAAIVNNAVTTAKISDSNITQGKLASPCVVTEHINDSAVSTAKINADAVTGAKIADNAIDSEHYVDGSIDAAHLANNAVETAKIADTAVTDAKLASNSVTLAKMADNSVGTSELVNDSVTTVKIANNAITAAKLAGDTITGAKIADDAIDSEHYVDGSIDTAHIADSQVTTAKLANAAVTVDKISTGAVTTVKIAADAIDGTKIGNDSLNSEHYSAGSIDTEHIADSQITTAKIADTSVTTAKLATDSVTTAKIADAELTTLAGMQTGTASILAGSTALTSTLSELNMLDGKSIVTTISASPTDAQLPTAQAVDERITTVVTDVGGFVPIANETSFPSTNPDVDNGAGTIVSIKALSSAIVCGSGVTTKTIANGAGSGNTVTINGLAQNTTYPAGRGMLVETTSTLHTYTYHRLTLDESGVADAQSAIDDFNARYRIHAGEPTGSLDDGDLCWDTNANKMKVYDSTASAWKEVTSSGDFKFLIAVDAGTTTAATFDGSDTSFDLKEGTNNGSAASVTSIYQLIISLNGVIQKPNIGSYSASEEGFYLTDSDTIRFCTAPPTGSTVFIVQIGSATTPTTPADNTVSTVKIQNGAVTTAKMASDAITGDKIADDAVGAEHIEDLDANVKWVDNSKAVFGTGSDFEIYHNGTDNYLVSGTGLIRIRHSNEDAIITNANGSVELYHNNVKKFETASGGISVTGSVSVDAGSNTTQAIFSGSGGSGARGLAILTESAGAADEGVIFNARASGTTATMKFQTNGSTALTIQGEGDEIDIPDDTKLRFGTGNDLKIYHDGTNTFIANSTGPLKIRSDTLELGAANGEQMLQGTANAAVNLYYDGVKTFNTESSGNTSRGQILKILAGEGTDATLQLVCDDGDDNADFWQIFADASHGGLNIQNYTSGSWENNIVTYGNGAVELYYDGSKKFETHAVGIKAISTTNECNLLLQNDARTWKIVNYDYSGSGGDHLGFHDGTADRLIIQNDGDIHLPADNQKLVFGAGDDLQVFHNGSDSYVSDTGTGSLKLCSNAFKVMNAADNEAQIYANENGAVELYYNNTKTFATDGYGCKVWNGPTHADAYFHIYAGEGGHALLEFHADEGDDNNDNWQLRAVNGGEFTLRSHANGSWENVWKCLTIDEQHGMYMGNLGYGLEGNLDPSGNGNWTSLGCDGQFVRVNGQAYLSVDDHLRIRDLDGSNDAERLRFDFQTNSGNAGAQNDWQDDQFDFAEMFEWSDGNPDNEDRIGHTVAVDGLTGKIKIAESGDTVIGVVSGTAAFTANCAGLGWHDKYERDEWGRYIWVEKTKIDGTKGTQFKVNSAFDATKEYIKREDRKEWDKIGIIGQCYVRKAAVIPSSWIKLKEIDSTKDFYLIK